MTFGAFHFSGLRQLFRNDSQIESLLKRMSEERHETFPQKSQRSNEYNLR